MIEKDRAKILVVDDRQENLFAMEGLLRDMDVEIYTATSGNEALKLTLNHDFALALLDVQMPDMDGFETAALMRENDQFNIPVIFVTAISKEEEHVFKGYDAGAVDYLFKPVNPDILRSKVQVFSQLYLARMKCNRMERELQNARNLESIGVLAGGIAHDFNNLLTGIMGAVQLAALELPADAKSRQLLDNATKASVQAAHLAKRLISFAKGDILNIQELSLVNVIREVAVEAIKDESIILDIRIPEDLSSVKADYRQLKRLFNNLLLNACEAMPEGGRITIKARLVHDEPGGKVGRWLMVKVIDQGKGIRDEDLPHIFEPYFSTKEIGVQKGMGLGLAICYSIVKKHGGTIYAHSEAGRGTTFQISLPYCSKPVEPTVEPEPVSEKKLTESTRVLVLDDEELIRNMASQMLSVLGYSVEVAAHGVEAIKKYKQAMEEKKPFSVVILDLTIPGGMGGLETLQRLKVIDPKVQAIVSSGYACNESMGDYKEHGFQCAVDKPYRMEALQQALNFILRQRQISNDTT